MFKTILLWILEWLFSKAIGFAAFVIQVKKKEQEIEDANKKNKEKLKKAETEEERKDATEDLAGRL